MERLSSHGSDAGGVSIQTNLSRMVSLSILDTDGKSIEVKTSRADPFSIFIPHDQSAFHPSMSRQNVTTMTNLSLFNYHFVSLTSKVNQSIHVEFESLNHNLSYLFIYRFDQTPIYNRSHQLIDGSFLLCASNHFTPSNKDPLFKFYVDNEQTAGHRSIFIAISELNDSEVVDMCSWNRSNTTHLRDDRPRNFTSDYYLRLYQSGCFYLDDDNRWKSDGLRVSLDNEELQGKKEKNLDVVGWTDD